MTKRIGMLMTKGLDSKILYSLLIVSGFVLTIGAASAVVMYSENIELDNGSGDSSIKITSSTGNSKLIIEDQGKRAYSFGNFNNINRLDITDETINKPRISLTKWGKVGIGIPWPQARLDVNGLIHTNTNLDVDGNLNVDGVMTGSYIATLEATIADLEARLAVLEAMVPANEVMIASHDSSIASIETQVQSISVNAGEISVNAGEISVNAGEITVNAGEITVNAGMIAVHDTAIDALEEGNPPPQGNPCNPDGDGVITPQEIWDYLDSQGVLTTETPSDFQSVINNIESGIPSSNRNGLLDDGVEVLELNLIIVPGYGVSACAFP